uniref:Putative secreted protein n=1 Tax=Anopheles darlingi TaxID=43151 RepID=A0A2M4DID1_ANODA
MLQQWLATLVLGVVILLVIFCGSYANGGKHKNNLCGHPWPPGNLLHHYEGGCVESLSRCSQVTILGTTLHAAGWKCVRTGIYDAR